MQDTERVKRKLKFVWAVVENSQRVENINMGKKLPIENIKYRNEGKIYF